MAANTKIEWATDTFNYVEGCEKISAGCKNCYASERDKRWHDGKHWGPGSVRKPMSEGYWRKPLKWNREAAAAGVRRRVFCSSLADVFELLPEDHPSARMQSEARLRLWMLIAETPHLDWLVLTKRPENFGLLLPWVSTDNRDLERAEVQDNDPRLLAYLDDQPPNVWLGVTAENQEEADRRIPILLSTPAAKRFVSYEPALEAVDFRRYMWPVHPRWPSRYRSPEDALSAGAEVTYHRQALVWAGTPFIDWIIAGAESGPGARPADDSWFRSARNQCEAAGVSFFLKQKAKNGKKISLPVLDGRRHAEVPA
jgi:protein gp37